MRDEADLHHLVLVASTERERDTGGSWRLPIGLTLLPCQQSSVHITVPLLYRLDPCHHTYLYQHDPLAFLSSALGEGYHMQPLWTGRTRLSALPHFIDQIA